MLDKLSPVSRTPLAPVKTATQTKNMGKMVPQLASVSNQAGLSGIASPSAIHLTQQAADAQGDSLHTTARQTLAEKLSLYNDYLYYGNNPEDSEKLVKELEGTLATLPQAEQLKALLPALNYLNKKLQQWNKIRELPTAQLAAITKRKEVIQQLIQTVTRLPDLLLKTDIDEHIAATRAAREGLKEELVASTLRRLPADEKAAQHAQIRQLLDAYPQPIALKERLEYFYACGLVKLQQPVHNELKAEIRSLSEVVKAARHLTAWSNVSDDPQITPVIDELATALEAFHGKLEKRLAAMFRTQEEIKKPVRDREQWLSHDGIRLSVPGKKLAHAVQQLPQKMLPGKKLTSLISCPAQSVSFMELSRQEKERCLALKKIAAPVQDSAVQLQQAAQQLKKAIREAIRENVHTLPDTGSPETALYAELLMLTEDNPQTRLMSAIQAAHTLATQVLSAPEIQHASAEKYSFPNLVAELNGTLTSVATTLRDGALLAEHNFRQQSVSTALQYVEKTAGEIEHLLKSGLRSATGVASTGNHVWLDKLQRDIRNSWQGITGLLSKGNRRYPTLRNKATFSAQEKALCGEIHHAVLPLLNETEKLRLACHQLEIASGRRRASDGTFLEGAVEKCRAIDLRHIQQAGEAISHLLSKQDIAVYQQGDEYAGDSVTLGKILSRLSMNLIKTGNALQQATWFAAWSPGSDSLRLTLSVLHSELDSIKKGIKDVVEAATGSRLHNNPPAGMIAKDAGEWLAALQQQGAEPQVVEEIVDQLVRRFTTPDDPAGKLFRQRLALAIKDAGTGQIPWPLTAEELLAGTKTNKDYTLAWAEKRLTYGLLYNLLIHGSPAGMLSMYKKIFVSPLRLLNLLLTPVRMELMQRNMEKVKPGVARPLAQLDEYHSREIYQMAFRLMSTFTPQLPKTIAALGIAGYGLAEGGEYRDAFLKRAISRLPADLFWISGFAMWRQAARLVGGSLRAGGVQRGQEQYEASATLAQLAAYPAALALQPANDPAQDASSSRSLTRGGRVQRSGASDDLESAAKGNAYDASSLAAQDKETSPDKVYSKEEVEKLIVKAFNNFNYIDTASKVINYQVIDDRVNEAGFNADGSVNKNYLIEKREFKRFFKDKLLQVVSQHDANKNFHDYIDKMLQKVISQEGVQFSKDNKNYIKLPTAIFYMYNSMLNHVRNFDKYSYYGGFDNNDILKFTRLKNTLKLASNWVAENYPQDMVKEFNKIDDGIYHASGITETEQRKLLDYITQPWLNKNSGLYKKLAKDIADNHEQYDTQHIISGIYNKTLDEINKVVSLPLPFMDDNSETGKYINSLTQVIKNAQQLFGGLYYYDGEDNINTSLAKTISEKIATTWDALDKSGGNEKYSAELERFIAINNQADNKSSLKKKYKALLNKQLDNNLKSLDDTDIIKKQKVINHSNAAFIAELQRLVAKNIASYPDKKDQLYKTLNDFCSGKMKKQDFILHRNEIVKYITDKTFNTLFNDNGSKSAWSLLLLSNISGVNLTEINTSSESGLLRSGEYARFKKASLEKYNNETIKYLEFGVRLLSLENPDESEKVIIRAFTEYEVTPFPLDDIQDEGELILHDDFCLALDFISHPLRADEDIKSLTESVIAARVKKFEAEKKETEAKLFKAGVSQSDFDKNLARLKKINILLLNLKLELKERLELINYIDDILAKCKKANGKYVADCLPAELSKDGVKNTEDVKVAAVKHFYNIKGDLTAEKRLEYLNIFNAHIAGATPDAYHLQNLASIYWVIFYHPSFNTITQNIMPWLGKDKTTGERTKFADLGSNETRSLQLRAMMSYASLSKLNTLLARYSDIYQQKEAFAEVITSGENLPGTYFSIADIKKRSEIPGHSLEAFSAQFSQYTPADLEADVTVITGQRIRKSGIDVRQLSLKPKAVYSFKHVERPHSQTLFTRDRTRPQPKDNDVVIVVTQDNSMLLSVAWGNQSAVYYLPPGSKQPSLAQLPAIVKDLAPYALDYQFKNRDKPEHMTKCRNALTSGLELFYDLPDNFTYGFENGAPSSDYLVLDANVLNIPADEDIYSWARNNLMVLQKTSMDIADSATVEDIFHQQFRDSLNETLTVMKEVYNDQEDIVGEVINATPLPLATVAAAARKLIDGLPLNDADIGLMIADVLGISDYFASGLNSLKKINLLNKTRNEISSLKINKGMVPGEVAKSLEKAVRSSLVNMTSKNPLSSFLPGKKIIKPMANQMDNYLSDLALSHDGKFLTSPSQAPLKDYAAQPVTSLKNARDFADNLYYDELRKLLGKKKLNQLGIKDKQPASKGMFFQGDIEEYIRIVEMHEQENILAEGQYRDAHLAHTKRVNDAAVRFTPPTQPAYGTVVDMVSQGYTLYGYGYPGIRALEQMGNDGAELLQRAKHMINGASSAGTLVNKADAILDQAFQAGHEPLLNNLKADLRAIWADLDDVQVIDILRTLSARNKLMVELLNGLRDRQFGGICFFSSNNPNRRALLGRIYPEDSSRSIFVNIGGDYLPTHKLILHETSHYASTEDFIYQNTGVYGTEVSLRDILQTWKAPQDVNAFMDAVSLESIGDFLGLSENEAIGLPHYQAVFEIVQSPNFVPDMLKNNADSFVEFIENMDKKYIIDEQNQVVVNPYYTRTRPARDLASAANSQTGKSDEADTRAKRLLLKMGWEMTKA